jgi:uncharacterized protein DUF1876
VTTYAQGGSVPIVRDNIELVVIHHPDVTTVVASALGFECTGIARRSPQDRNDAQVGIELAMGRAIRQLGRQMLHEANEMVRRNSTRDKRQRQAEADHQAQRAEMRKAREEAKALLQRTEH